MQAALVTGGARGIGAAIARALADRGFSVGVHARAERDSVHEFAASLPGGPHLPVFGDISKPQDATSIVARCVQSFGRLDLVVNNAGVYREGPVSSDDFEKWQMQWTEVFGTNVFGTANVSFAAVEHFLSRAEGPRGARIVNIGSRGAYRGEPDAPAYGASKAAIHSLTQSLAASLGSYGIAVAGVAPGFIDTELARERLQSAAGAAVAAQSPFGRVGTPSEVASAVAWLASPDALWATGTIIDVNGASYFR